MAVTRAQHAIAGYYAQIPDLPELQILGEQWLASRTDIADHAHASWEVYLQLDGEADWHDQRGATTLGPGDGYLVAPGVRHHLGSVRGTRHHFLYALIDAERWVAARLPQLGSVRQQAQAVGWRTGPAAVLREPLRLLADAVTHERPHRLLAASIALDAVVLAMLSWAVTPEETAAAPVEHRGVSLVRQRIDNDPGRRWTLTALAEDTGLTPKHLCTLFGRQVGRTPHQYLLHARLAAVRHALHTTDLSVTQLAVDFGFASSQHLSRVFAAKCGVSPRAFRAQARARA